MSISIVLNLPQQADEYQHQHWANPTIRLTYKVKKVAGRSYVKTSETHITNEIIKIVTNDMVTNRNSYLRITGDQGGA